MTRKFGALEESCASGEPSGGEGPEESVRRSLPGRAEPGKVSERATGAALRSAPTCAPPAKLRGLARLAGGGGGGGRDTAGSSFQRGPAETPVPLVFWAMRRESGVPRGPCAFLETPPLALGWAGDVRMWGQVGRERRAMNFHRSAGFPLAAFCRSAARKGGREGTRDGEQPGNHGPGSWAPIFDLQLCGTGWDLLPGWCLPGAAAVGSPSREERERRFQADEEFLMLLLLLLLGVLL